MKASIKKQIGEFFNYSMNWDFLDIVANVLERVDFENEGEKLEESIQNAIDDELIYTEDRWTLIMFYQNPEEANMYEAFDDLYSDICALVEKIKGE